MTKQTTTTTTTTITTTTKPQTRFATIPKTFFEVIKMLLATDIAEGDFKILALRESGKFGYGRFLITGENESGPFKDYFVFKYEPGDRFMNVFIQDEITKETFKTQEDMRYIYGMTDYDCAQ